MSDDKQPGNFLGMTADKRNAVVKLDMEFNAAGLDNLIRQLIDIRGQIEPPHPEEPPLRKFQPILWTKWHCAPEAMNGNSALMFRNPGFGWMPFLLDEQTRQKLIEALTKQAGASPIRGTMN